VCYWTYKNLVADTGSNRKNSRTKNDKEVKNKKEICF
jgi:hypothetical protein